MIHQSFPSISSFVIRFVQAEPQNPSSAPAFRGSIHHIQSDQELSFTRWADALAFMEQFVPAELLDLAAQPIDPTDKSQIRSE
jgi:hypothetical protein